MSYGATGQTLFAFHSMKILKSVFDQPGFSFIRKIPKCMLSLVPTSNKILQRYMSSLITPYPQRPLRDKTDKPKKVILKKHKASTGKPSKTIPNKKRKKGKAKIET
ncbi:hypothetical protein L2E82_05653 [Cichorium intybus]|uniref:Uncharacterized protein n=1 Tax=Cichorium intybus TaxID=13427 RepID=A0ACB9H7S4_CICIN|nr:hypothetical protein L2E82_05653 [Cichorium intybus]